MNILFYDMGSYIYHDFLQNLKNLGHSCKTLYYHFSDKYEDTFFCNRFLQYLEADNYDVVISVNFFPLVAQLCYQKHIKYLAWCYDSPLEDGLRDFFHFETNYIFLFDSVEVSKYQADGYSQVYHMPLAVDTQRLSGLSFTQRQIASYSSDVSFVGHLYDSSLDALLFGAGDYIKGYIEGIVQSQLRLYGYYMIDELISDDLVDSINSSFRINGQTAVTLSKTGLSYAIAAHITHIERSFLIEQMGALYETHFYSTRNYAFSSQVKSCGPVKYLTEMPGVFRYSRLNICPTLKSIQAGIPLRSLDIMGAGGTLLSNYQPELAEHFENEKDCIMYDSMEDAFAKTDFYLRHENLRHSIAENGHKKICRDFSYPDRIKRMFKIAKLSQ